jgi:hypothetical protein
MKIGKIVAIATLAIAAGQAVTATAATGTVCTGGTAKKADMFGGTGTPVTDTSTSLFVKTGFSAQCSANVFMNYNDASATSFGVAAVSAKGNQIAGGNSNGGAIGVLGKCSAASCAVADVQGTILTGASVAGS